MNEDRSIIWERVIKGMEAGIITQDEARDAVGYEALEAALEQNNTMDDDVMDKEEDEEKNKFNKYYNSVVK